VAQTMINMPILLIDAISSIAKSRDAYLKRGRSRPCSITQVATERDRSVYGPATVAALPERCPGLA
jgi:hypothetical protein